MYVKILKIVTDKGIWKAENKEKRINRYVDREKERKRKGERTREREGKGQRERERIILYVKILKIVSNKGIWKAENREKKINR